MHKFIRIEKDELGPYVYADEYDFDWMVHNHHDCEFTPSIQFDSGFTSEDKMIYELNARSDSAISGFTSMEQLKNWFSPKELNSLKKEGFKIKTYYVSKIHDSGLQAFILKDYIVK